MTHILNIVQIHFIRQAPEAETYLDCLDPQSQVINSLQMTMTPNITVACQLSLDLDFVLYLLTLRRVMDILRI